MEPKTVFDRELSAAETKESIEDQIQNLQQMLQSRTMLERIVEEFKLRSDDTSVPMEDALKTVRENLEILRTSGGTFAMAYYASSPQVAQAITNRLTQIVIELNREAQKAKAVEKDKFLEMELAEAEREMAGIDQTIAAFRRAHAGGRQESVELQILLRHQARAQRHVDEIDRMNFSAEMAASFISTRGGDQWRILDEASLPERPEFPARLHILWMGIVLAFIAALPAVFLRKKAPQGSA